MRRVWMLVLPSPSLPWSQLQTVAWPMPFRSNRSRLVQWLPRPTSSWRTKPSVVHAEERPSVAHVAG